MRSPKLGLLFGAVIASVGIATLPSDARAYDCTSPDPAQWPPSSKPYFMIIVDTSGSMNDNNVNPIMTDSCGYGTKRTHHARCAVRNTINAFAGQVNFGLAGYARKISGCGATCSSACLHDNFIDPPNDHNACGPRVVEGTLGATLIHRGAEIYVPMLQDHYWSDPPDPSNVASLLSFVDNNCTNDVELGANSNTPLGGALHEINSYYSNTYTDLYTGAAVPTPLGTFAQGERGCRSVNIIFITDGDEVNCDEGLNPPPINGGCASGMASYPNANGERIAEYEADRLFHDGVTFGSQNFKVKTHVIGFAGATTAALDHIAACGGTGASHSTANEADLASALAQIISSSVAPEGCDNADNNCNGCVDEGYTHYCDVGQTCCGWTTDAQRTTCLNNYKASITSGNPQGDLTLLPCTTVAQQTDSAHWLCFNPGDKCDGTDNNCANGPDEGATKCGSPPHCPVAETCNGLDDNCNGSVDEGGVCGTCVPSPETCDGCDNDCDGIVDNGVAAVACGLTSPPNCAGTKSCKAPQPCPGGVPGCCVSGGGFNSCTNNPQPETCDGVDNNCDGTVDNVPSVPCVPTGTPPGLVYGGTSQCQMGQSACVNGMTVCQGFVGPSAEICDGIDNDCDGVVDDTPFGAGQPCGTNNPPCTLGTTQCVSGALVCTGGVQPQPEICDGIDNNCNGAIDEAPLADAPAPGANGCWALPGNCCSHQNLHWCPPTGGTCNGVGSLSAPCNTGTLQCAGSMGWKCQGGTLPSPEVCDGVDNNCNNAVDEGMFPGEGQACGTNTGECQQGVIDCQNGVLDCVGDVGPQPEVCDGLDNDCDGTVDNGIVTGGPCDPIDHVMWPNADVTKGVCQPGVLACDGNGGTTCQGGVGPSAEVCDGIDNDCDGMIDEAGPAPDGINGSANPQDPTQHIGDTCGVNQGNCTQGQLACVNGLFQCLGGTGPQPETCDCGDQDCDGNIDNPNPGNNPPLCGTGKTCVSSSQGCQCATPCGTGEFPCPTGQVCEMVTDSNTGMPLGEYCIATTCNNCEAQVITDANGTVLCGPPGTPTTGCAALPECTCKGQDGCKAPCFGVTCQAPLVCTNFGANAGTCVADNCFNIPCQTCGDVCDNTGSCKPNPCTPTTCADEGHADYTCKPTSDFNDHICVPSCADVTCNPPDVCKDGQCVPTCDPACPTGKTCDMTQTPPACVDDQCTPTSCPNGGCCNPVTGACGVCDPCEGIICPMDQKCSNGECEIDMGEGGASSSSSSSATGAGGGSSATGATGSGGAANNGVFGLATGGGGCSCEVGPGADAPRQLGMLAVGLGLVLARYKRRRPRRNDEESDESVDGGAE